jgi:hypothetical protein
MASANPSGAEAGLTETQLAIWLKQAAGKVQNRNVAKQRFYSFPSLLLRKLLANPAIEGAVCNRTVPLKSHIPAPTFALTAQLSGGALGQDVPGVLG